MTLSHPTFADSTDGIVETTFFGNLKDDGGGCGVYMILNSVVDILSIGIGILAIIGITIVGIKYLTAKGDISQTKKAKTRLLQIVIGLVAYVLLYAGIEFLLPGGKLNTSQQCTTISDQELATLKEQEKAEKAAEKKTTSSKTDSSGSSASSSAAKGNTTCLKNAIKVVKDAGICEAKPASERIARTAELFAWSEPTSPKIYRKRPTAALKQAVAETITPRIGKDRNKPYAKGRSCSVFVSAVVRSTGYDKNFGGNRAAVATIISSAKSSNKWKEVPRSKAVRGDVFTTGTDHVKIYGGKKDGKYVWIQASKGDHYGHISYGSSPAKQSGYRVWHAIGE